MSQGSEATRITILSTMVGPLWARATFSQRYPDLLTDHDGLRIFEALLAMHPEPEAKARFDLMREFIDEFLGLSLVIRARTFDHAIGEYLKEYPEATVVNIGCGLDTTFSRVDNGRIHWHDLDLPEAIEYRRKLIPDSPRSSCISKSVLDHSWFNDVRFAPDRGVLFFSGGLFNYFREDKVSDLCRAMSERFPGGQLVFDAPSGLGNRVMNRRFRKRGVTGVEFSFGLGNPTKQIPKWSDRIRLVEWFPLYARTERNPKWRIRTRVLMDVCDLLGVVKVAHLRFLLA